MLKKTIEFTDYNGVDRKEDHYFNLTKAELMEMELGTSGGFTNMVQQVIDHKDGPTIMRVFKDLILKSYGVKSPDGRRFIKSEEISKEFEQTEAYSNFFMELVTDSEASAAFVKGIIPGDIDTSEIENKLAVVE